ncbi:MAG: membrane protein insertase YidC [Alphaproteobacteria bacterium]
MKPNSPMTPEERARIIVAVALSLLVLLGYQWYAKAFPHQKAQEAISGQQAPKPAINDADGKPVTADAPLAPREEAVEATGGRRIEFSNGRIHGTIPTVGNRMDDVLIDGHYEDMKGEKFVPLLSPAGSKRAFYLENGWLAGDGAKDQPLPGPDTVWSKTSGSPDKLEGAGRPVVLKWDNGKGLVFERSFELDRNFLFTVKQRVTNNTGNAVSLNSYHVTARNSLPVDYAGIFTHHEGFVGFLNKKSYDPQYADIAKGEKLNLDGATGWLGISDKYWLVAMMPKPDETFNVRVVGSRELGADKAHERQHYQGDIVQKTQTIQPGSSAEDTIMLFTGVKALKAIQFYERERGIDHLELSIDFGMWYFITKPFYHLLQFLFTITAQMGFGVMNVAVSILLMTLIIRAGMFPIVSRQFKSMAKMKIVSPLMKELQVKFKDDKPRLQAEMFELYKKHDVNPFSSCLPIFIQIPVFFALYKVLMLSVELRHAPFWGWIDDLSVGDPTTIFNLFGLLPFDSPVPLTLGLWPVMFGITMLLQKHISPPMPDPMQEKLQTFLPLLFTVMFAQFPVGLVIYYTWSGLLGVLQQYYILKKISGEDTSLLRGHAGRRKGPKIKHKDAVDAEVAETGGGDNDKDGAGGFAEIPGDKKNKKKKH